MELMSHQKMLRGKFPSSWQIITFALGQLDQGRVKTVGISTHLGKRTRDALTGLADMEVSCDFATFHALTLANLNLIKVTLKKRSWSPIHNHKRGLTEVYNPTKFHQILLEILAGNQFHKSNPVT